MKKSLVNLQDALAYRLNGLYDVEKKLQESIPDCLHHVGSPALLNEMQKYADSTRDKVTKLERVFNYLMEEPEIHPDEVMEKMIEDVYELVTHAAEPLRDALIISCLQNINHYKISGYGTARAMAMQLEFEKASELLNEILTWEKEMDQRLTLLAMEEVNVKAAEPKFMMTM